MRVPFAIVPEVDALITKHNERVKAGKAEAKAELHKKLTNIVPLKQDDGDADLLDQFVFNPDAELPLISRRVFTYAGDMKVMVAHGSYVKEVVAHQCAEVFYIPKSVYKNIKQIGDMQG